MKNKAHFEALRSVLAEAGITDTWVTHGGKHPRLYWRRDGKKRFYVFPTSPSDRRAIENAKSDLRKRLGVERPINKNGNGKKKAKSSKPAPELPSQITASNDPWAKLKDHPANNGPRIPAPQLAEPKPSAWDKIITWVKGIFK